MAGLVTVAISPHKSSCNGSTFWLPAVGSIHPKTVASRALLAQIEEARGSTQDGCVAKKEADLVQWRETSERGLHHESSQPESF
jgi:hypothetical protein